MGHMMHNSDVAARLAAETRAALAACEALDRAGVPVLTIDRCAAVERLKAAREAEHLYWSSPR